MLEKQISSLLADNLRRFIRDLNEEQLQISLWAGDLILRNLQLQPDILDQISLLLFQNEKHSSANEFLYNSLGNTEEAAAAARALLLPFTVVKGVLRELVIRVPWSSLDSESVTVEVRGVDLVLGPLRNRTFNAEEEDSRLEVLKQMQLGRFEGERSHAQEFCDDVINFEASTTSASGAGGSPHGRSSDRRAAAASAGGTTSATGGNNSASAAANKSSSVSSPLASMGSDILGSSYVQSLVNMITRNVCVVVKDVSLQYIMDYDGLHPQLSSAISLWVGEICVVTTDESSMEHCFVVDDNLPVCKAVSMADIRIAVHRERTTGAAPVATDLGGSSSGSVEEGGLVDDKADFLLLLEKSGSMMGSSTGSALDADRYQHYLRQWKYNQTLVSCDEVVLHVKAIPAVKSDAKKKGNKSADAESDTADGGGAPAHTSVAITTGKAMHIDLSFGAALTLVSLARSLQRGLDGAIYRKYLHLLDDENNNTTSEGCSPPVPLARRRWNFALACVRSDVRRSHQKLHGSMNAAMMTFCKHRRAYCGLWKRQQRVPWLPPLDAAERQELTDIEQKLSLEQTVFCRCLAYAEITYERGLMRKQQQLIEFAGQHKQQQQQHTGGQPQTGKGNILGWLWRRKNANINTEDAGSDSALAEGQDADSAATSAGSLFDHLHVEWEIGQRFIHERVAGRNPNMPSPSSVPAADNTRRGSLVLHIRSHRIRLRVMTNHWGLLRRDQSFLSHVGQQLCVVAKSVEVFVNTVQVPCEDRAGFSFYMGSIYSYFSGTFNTPLLRSKERVLPPPQGKEDFLVLKRNATGKRVTLVVSPLAILLRPAHELLWWTSELLSFQAVFMDHLRSFTAGGGGGPPVRASSPSSPVQQLVESIDVTMNSIDVVVPLEPRDITSGSESELGPQQSVGSHSHCPTSAAEGSATSTQRPVNSSTSSPSESVIVGSDNDVDEATFVDEDEDNNNNNEGASPLDDDNDGAGAFDYWVRQTDACIVLSVHCVRLKTLPREGRPGSSPQHPEFVITVGDDNKTTRLYCLTGSLSSGGSRGTPTADIRNLEIVSLSVMEVLITNKEVFVGLYNGVEVALQPTVFALLNDKVFKPCALFDSTHVTRTESLVEHMMCKGSDEWFFATPVELRLSPESVLTLPAHGGRDYVTLLFRWWQRANHAANEGKNSRMSRHASLPGGLAVPVEATTTAATTSGAPHSTRSFAIGIEFIRVIACDMDHEEIVEVELMAPEHFPPRGLPYRRYFTAFTDSPHSVEIVWMPDQEHLLCMVPGLAVNTTAGQAIAAADMLTVEFEKGKLRVDAESTSLFFRNEVVQCLETVVGAAKALQVMPLPTPRRRSSVEASLQPPPVVPAAGDYDQPVSVKGGVSSIDVRIAKVSVQLPLSSLIQLPQRALSATVSAFQVSTVETDQQDGAPQALEIKGEVERVLRLEEDILDDELTQYVVVGPSSGMLKPPEKMTFVVTLDLPPPRGHGEAAMPSPVPPRCSFHVRGGHACLYMPFIQQSLAAISDPLYVRLLNIQSTLSFHHGLTFVPERWPLPSLKTAAVPAAPSSPPMISGLVEDVEVLLATDSDLPVDVSDNNTFFYLRVGKVKVEEHRARRPSAAGGNDNLFAAASAGAPLRKLDVVVGDVSYLASHDIASLSPLLSELVITVRMGALLVPREDLSGYTYQQESAPSDVTVVVGTHDVSNNNNNNNTNSSTTSSSSSPAVEVVLSPSRAAALTEAVLLNIAKPAFHPSQREALSRSNTSSCTDPNMSSTHRFEATAAVAVMVTVPTIRVVCMTTDSRIVSLSMTEGLQFYRVSGGKWWRCPVQNVQIRGLYLNDVTPEDVVIDPLKPRAQQSWKRVKLPEPRQTRPLLHISRIGLTVLVSTDDAPISSGINYVRVDGIVEAVTLYPDVASWASLLATFSSPLAKAKQSSSPIHSRIPSSYQVSGNGSYAEQGSLFNAVDGGGAAILTEVAVAVKDVRVLLKEPWGEVLADLQAPEIHIHTVHTSDRVTKVDVTLANGPAFLVRSSMGTADAYDAANFVPLIAWHCPPPSSGVGEDQQHMIRVSFTSTVLEDRSSYQVGECISTQPIMQVPSLLQLSVAHVHLCMHTIPCLRLGQFIVKELLPTITQSVERLFTSVSADITPQPSFTAMAFKASLRDLKATVPLTPSGIAAHDAQGWSLQIAEITVDTLMEANEVQVLVTAEPGKPNPLAGQRCIVWCRATQVHTHGVELLHQGLPPVSIPDIAVSCRLPLEGSTYSERMSMVTFEDGADASASPVTEYIFLSRQEYGCSLLYRKEVSVQTAEASPAVFSFSLGHIEKLWALASQASRSIASVAVIQYYSQQPTGTAAAAAAVVATASPPPFSVMTEVSVHIHIPQLTVQLLEASSPGLLLSEVHIAEPIHVWYILPAAESEQPSNCRVSLTGDCVLYDAHRNSILFRQKRPTDHNSPTWESMPPTLCVSVSLPYNNHTGSSAEAPTISVETSGIVVDLSPATVDYMRRMHEAVTATMAKVATPIQGDLRLPSVAAPERKQQQQLPSVTLLIRDVSAAIGDYAIVEARSISINLNELAASQKNPDAAHTFQIGNVALLSHSRERTHAMVESVEVELGIGRVVVRVQSVAVHNYDAYFYRNIIENALVLQAYIKETSIPKKAEEGFKLEVLVSLADTRIALHVSSASSCHGQIECNVPAVVIRHMSSRSAQQLSVEVEGVEVTYRDLVSPLLDAKLLEKLDVSLALDDDYNEQSRKLSLRLGTLAIAVPMGDPLQCCAEAASLLVLPLMSISLSQQQQQQSSNASYAAAAAALSVGGASVSAAPSPTARSIESALASSPQFTITRLSLHAPSVSVSVMAQPGSKELAHASSGQLFGVQLHQLLMERVQNPTSQISLLQIVAVTSTVDPSIQTDLLSLSAPPDAVDTTSAAAVYLRHEKLFLPRPSDIPNAKPLHKLAVTGRIYNLQLTLSPSILRIVNEAVLAHVASGVYHVRQAADIWEVRPQQQQQHTIGGSSQSLEGQDRKRRISSGGDAMDKMLVVSSDLCIRKDLVLGGKQGVRIRFCKGSDPSAPNVIRLKSINHSRVLLSMIDLPQGPSQAPIVIDEGLTVKIEETPVVVEAGAESVLDYVSAGERSVFQVPDSYIQRVQDTNRNSSGGAAFSPVPPDCSGSDAAGSPLQHATPLIAVRADVDIFAHVTVRLWSQHQVVASSFEVSAQYNMQKNVYEKNTRQLASFDNEHGEVLLRNLQVMCDSGPITSSPINFSLSVMHHKLPEDHSRAGVTALKGVLPPTQLTFSIGHLKLFYDILQQLRTGTEHIGATLDLGDDTDDGETNNQTAASAPLLLPPLTARSAHVGKHSQLPSGGGGGVSPSVEIGLTVPLVELMITNDFFKAEVMISVANMVCQARGRRDFSQCSATSTGTLTVRDYPALEPPRTILALSPECSLEYEAYPMGGRLINGSLACAEAILTVPLVTAVRALQYRFEHQKTGAFSFRNGLGTPVVVLTTAAAASRASPDAGGNSGGGGTPLYCCIPPGETVKADLFHYNQMRFRVVLGDAASVAGSCNPSHVGSLGTEVDISILQKGATYRFPLEDASTGILDIVLRLDETERLLHITSCVKVFNNLEDRVLGFPDAAHMEIQPHENCYATLAALKQPFSVAIDGHCSHKNPLLSLQAVINSFLLLPEDKAMLSTAIVRERQVFWNHAALFNTGTFVMPLLLVKEGASTSSPTATTEETPSFSTAVARSEGSDGGQIVVNAVFKKQVARESQPRTARFLPKYEVELHFEPMVSVLNLTGTTLVVEMVAASPSHPTSTATSEPRCGGDKSKPLPHGGRYDWYPTRLEDVEFAPRMRLHVQFNDDCSLQLDSIDDVSLSLQQKVLVALSSGSQGSEQKVSAAVLVERISETKVAVQALAIMENRLPFPIRLYDLADKSSLIGCPSGELVPGATQPMLYPCSSGTQPNKWDSVVSVSVAAGGVKSKKSIPFVCNSPALSVVLSSEGDGGEYFFLATQATNSITAAPWERRVALMSIILQPVWVIRNAHATCRLRVRCFNGALDGEKTAVVIDPLATAELVQLSSKSGGDPEVQFRYELGDFLFEWSPAIKLATLASASVPLFLKHTVALPPSPDDGAEDVQATPLPLYRNDCVPTHWNTSKTQQRFGCLSLVPSLQNGQHVVRVHLDAEAPVVIENRTPHQVQFEQKLMSSTAAKAISSSGQKAWGYIIEPFSDCTTSWDIASLESPAVRLQVYGRGTRCSCVVDLHKAASSKEAIKAGEGVFIFVAHDYRRRRFFMTITEDRMLEGRALLQPQLVTHLELFLRDVCIYVAAPCVMHRETSLEQTPFFELSRQQRLNLNASIAADSTDAEVLSALKYRELDVVLLRLTGVFAETTWNERHILCGVDLGQVELVDCTSPSPVYPVVLRVAPQQMVGEGNGGKEQAAPCFSLVTHLVWPQTSKQRAFHALPAKGNDATAARQLSKNQKLYARRGRIKKSHVTQRLVSVPVQEIKTRMSPVKLYLHDTFLFVARQAVECTLAEVTASGGTASAATPTPSSASSTVFDMTISSLSISAMDVEVTLTRRADAKYNPFAGLPMGNLIIPSVETAPISIRALRLRDVSQRSSSLPEAAAAILWPAYRAQMVLQLYKVVGSLEVLGNPISLIGGWSRGVRCFVEGAVDLNFAGGASGFWREATSSTLHSVSLISRVGGRALSTLSMDGEWLEKQQMTRRRSNLGDSGLWQGVSQGISGGVGGLLSEPISGAKSSGVPGFFAGVATGMVSFVSRPIAGLLHGVGGMAEYYATVAVESSHAHGDYMKSERNFFLKGDELDSSSNTESTSTTDWARYSAGGMVPLDVTAAGTSRIPYRDFLSIAAFNRVLRRVQKLPQQQQQPSAEERITRALIAEIGAHNVALHADYRIFHQYASPEEFFNWFHVALHAHLSRSLRLFLIDAAERDAHRILLLSVDGLPVGTKMLMAQDGGGTDSASRAGSAERAQTIKTTLGPQSLMKYVGVDDFVKVCTIDEIQAVVAPAEFQAKCGVPLAMQACEGFRNTLEAPLRE